VSTINSTTLPLLPLPHGVFFPEMVVTVRAESSLARAAFEAASRRAGSSPAELVAVPQIGGEYSPIGLVVRIEQAGRLPGGGEGAVLRGLRRVRVGQGEVGPDGVLLVTVTEVDADSAGIEAEALAVEYRQVAGELLQILGGGRLAGLLDGLEDPGALADTLGWWPDLDEERRLELFKTVDVTERITQALAWAKEALVEAQVTRDITSDVQEGFEKDQREAILRRQMESIRNELGQTDDDIVSEYRTRLADGTLPEKMVTAVGKELDRLERMGDQSMEANWIRTWLETVFDIPWGERSSDSLNLANAESQLDSDHTGLEKVKERILEFLAVRKLRQQRGIDETGGRGGGTILALVGPPGVGKTSLGESIAKSTGRRFVRMSLGAITTKPRSVAIAAPTSVPALGVSFGRSSMPAP